MSGTLVLSPGRLPIEPTVEERRFLLETAFLLAANQDMPNAIVILSGLLEIAEDQAIVHFWLGRFLASDQALSESISHLDEAIRLQPDWPAPVRTLADVLLASGRIEEARVASARVQAFETAGKLEGQR